jgi:hypothetical protein
VHGRPVAAGGASTGPHVALFGPDGLVGVAEPAVIEGTPVLKPRVVVVDG